MLFTTLGMMKMGVFQTLAFYKVKMGGTYESYLCALA